MWCEVGSCKAKATFVVSEAYPYNGDFQEIAACGRHVAPILAQQVSTHGAVEVCKAPESHVQPRSQPGGTQGDPLAARTVQRPYRAPDTA